MRSNYKTELGSDGHGRGAYRTSDGAMKFTHDIFLRAAHEKLDIYMLWGNLTDDFFTEVTGVSLAELVRQVLEAGRNVSIFIWGDGSADSHPAQMMQLINEASISVTWGKFELFSSGTNDGEDSINHFIIAKSADNDMRWIVYVEQSHPRLTKEQLTSKNFEIPTEILFDTDEARQYGAALLKVYNELRRRVNKQAAQPETTTI